MDKKHQHSGLCVKVTWSLCHEMPIPGMTRMSSPIGGSHDGVAVVRSRDTIAGHDQQFIPAIGMTIRTLLLTLAFSLAAYAQPLILTTGDVLPRSSPDGKGFVDLILKEALGRLKLDYRIEKMPSERALANLSANIDDGNFCRPAGITAQYPNIILVKVPLASSSFNAFVLDTSIRIKDSTDLAKYNVGYIRGWKVFEYYIKQTKSLTLASNEETLFELLVKQRVDVVLFEKGQGLGVLHRLGLTSVHLLEPPLFIRDLFMYMAPKDAPLVPRLESTLRAMQDDGTTARIMKTFQASNP